MMLGTVNLWAVLGAAAAAFATGALWHGPLFGKQWMKMMGFTMKDLKKMMLTPGQSMGMAAVVQVVVAYILARTLELLSVSSVAAGLHVAVWIWLGFQAPLLFGSFLWENKSFKLWAFNASYRLVEICVMAAILARFA